MNIVSRVQFSDPWRQSREYKKSSIKVGTMCWSGGVEWKSSSVSKAVVTNTIHRDQPNSQFHGRDIFREIGLLLWKTPISVFPWNP